MCLIKVGGLELWRPNLCLNCASSSWPWELLCWTECYLFGHLIHTHKWPLGAVFDKQTDWIACVNVCGFSPLLSSRPLKTSPIYLKDMENSTRLHTAQTRAHVCIYSIHLTLYAHINTLACAQANILSRCTCWPSLIQFSLYSLIRAPRIG